MRAKIHTRVFHFVLCLGFTAVAASALSGCVVDNRTNPPTGSCVDQRFATVAWNIEKAATGAPLSCFQANADTVLLFFGQYSYSYNCDDGTNNTDPGLTPGNYATYMQLLAPDNTVLSDTRYGVDASGNSVFIGPTSFPIYSCSPDDIPTVTFGIR